jgi:hypothetical protein
MLLTRTGATIDWQSSKVAGTPTHSMAVSTPMPPVSFLTASAAAALPALLLTVFVAPNVRED